MTLRECYAQPWRHFHTWDHIERVQRAAQWYYQRLQGTGTPPAVTRAIFWHDAVYLPGAADNEEKSVELYKSEEAIKMSRHAEVWVAQTIRATKEHIRGFMGMHGMYCPRNVMLSCDLVSLAAPWDVFCTDEENILKEYRYAYEDAKCKQGRLAFLEGMLAHPYIYPHPDFELSHGPRARANLQRAVREAKPITFVRYKRYLPV